MAKDDVTIFEVLGRQYILPYTSIGNQTKEHILIEATILFAMNGYSAVSMRDIAVKVGLTPGALYNHFAGKEELWDAVLDHGIELYFLYHRHLEEELEKAKTFEEMLDIMFSEPKQMKNMFTCYAFGLIQTEQFRNKRAGELFNDVLLKFGRDFTRQWLDRCVERGMVEPFDTFTVASMFVHTVMIGISLRVQESLDRTIPCKIDTLFEKLKQFILSSVGKTKT
ncbi:MAG: TetR/AcrR family transcriptional regulator [Synergistaceae bacterium]|nr:TetR/AcrR family transcriptional regulator [Synergistaceae bacterium]